MVAKTRLREEICRIISSMTVLMKLLSVLIKEVDMSSKKDVMFDLKDIR